MYLPFFSKNVWQNLREWFGYRDEFSTNILKEALPTIQINDIYARAPNIIRNLNQTDHGALTIVYTVPSNGAFWWQGFTFSVSRTNAAGVPVNHILKITKDGVTTTVSNLTIPSGTLTHSQRALSFQSPIYLPAGSEIVVDVDGTTTDSLIDTSIWGWQERLF